jgi:hypothetical protein
MKKIEKLGLTCNVAMRKTISVYLEKELSSREFSLMNFCLHPFAATLFP